MQDPESTGWNGYLLLPLDDFGLDGRIQKVTGGTDTFRIRAESANIAQQTEVTAALAETVGVTPNDISRSEVGPSWGQEISAVRALSVIS